MNGETQSYDPPPKPGPSRARSLPFRGDFVVAVILSALHFLGLIALLTSLVILVLQPGRETTVAALLTLAFTVVSWLVAYFKRRTTRCPLCKGTPLVNGGARVHSKATRLFPFNHGVTAILSIIATHRFRCMYCGSPYDLLKVPSHRRDEPAARIQDTRS